MNGSASSAIPLQKQKVGAKVPAKEIMPLFKKHQLHSGSSTGPIVTNPHQAKAIQLSYARKEGADIPEPKTPARRFLRSRKKRQEQP